VPESDSSLKVVDNPTRSRYEAHAGGEVAGYITYRTRPGVVVLVHTEVEPAFEGRGVGSKMARSVLEALRSGGMQVDPVCPFIVSYIKRHPEYDDLVARSDT
jgi:predicted GNAT family acetyltransferase